MLSDEELDSCFAAMRNGYSYLNGKHISDGDGEELVRAHIEALKEIAAGAIR